ncbi:MAG: TIGR02281 family clan AA aspartic protease [Alphaproteobacteria bacterium]|nr:MAG: TIGR02281 family clan AA aspartic protease [Alphaproteobacteria bacterium]
MITQVKWIIIAGCVAAFVIGLASRSIDAPGQQEAKLAQSSQHLSPGSSELPAYGDEVVVRRARDGHFWVEADINGVTIPFLVDTGASHVVLSPADADRLGLYLTPNDYTQSYDTANGVVRAAPVELAEVRIGPLRVSNVTASVNGAPLRQSLLGMSFLGRLDGFEYRGDDLVLRR